MSKYDFDLDLSTRNSLSLIVKRIKPNSKILEFGPAHGRLTKYLKEEMGCEVYTVELDKKAAKDAAKYSKEIIVGNIEDYEWFKKYKNLRFDYIIFADVLEHLYYPDKVLTQAKELLHKDGSVLISLPNIAHNAVIMDLLNDRFTYRETGLLDNTHIRFFTKKTIDKFIEKCGLKISYETGVYAAPQQTEFGYAYNDFDSSIVSHLYQHQFGEVYQFIIEAKRKVSEAEIVLEKKEMALLFYDTGKGFNSIEVLKTSYSPNVNKELVFSFETEMGDVKALRIDPLEFPFSIKIDKVLVNSIEIPYDQLVHNGFYMNNSEIVFGHSDPQISFLVPDDVLVNEVVFKYEYINDILDSKAILLKAKEQQLQQKEQQIQQLREEMATLQEIAESMRIKNRLKKVFKFYKKATTS